MVNVTAIRAKRALITAIGTLDDELSKVNPSNVRLEFYYNKVKQLMKWAA